MDPNMIIIPIEKILFMFLWYTQYYLIIFISIQKIMKYK
jgi:hypothetical protein